VLLHEAEKDNHNRRNHFLIFCSLLPYQCVQAIRHIWDLLRIWIVKDPLEYMSIAYATWAYAHGERGRDARSKIAYSVLEARQRDVQSFSLKFFIEHFADRHSRVRIIGDVEAKFVAQQFLTPSI